ncbi:MAG: hypothetical protein O7E52_18425 [Candidatus Poribacteria bacterium]|nr:hypothetical protein [Candidatus Poribacteria bacterium]
MESQEAVERRYRGALDDLIAKVKKDRNIIAAILGGSLSYDQVWEKSDIDLWLIQRDGKGEPRDYSLIEDGVNIHANVIPRSESKRWQEAALQGSFQHSYFSRSTLLFTHDESIKDWYQNANLHHIGARDMALQLLTVTTELLPTLTYAEKQFYVNKDLNYSFLSILRTVEGLARVEVILNDEVPSREVIQPALKYNPDFFNVVYADLINRQKDEAVIQNALDAINAYLDDKTFIFQPILDFLAEADGPRSTTELNAYFQKKVGEDRLDAAYEWLATKGLVQQVSTPVKLARKSQVEMEEAAYYCDRTETAMSEPSPLGLKGDVHSHIMEALDTFVDRVKGDRYIIAAILTSNLAADNVWEKINVNLILISRDDAKTDKTYSLLEDGVNIRATIYPRGQYKKMLEGGLQGSELHSILSRSRILFSRDEAIAVWHKSLDHIGEKDRETQLMNAGSGIFGLLAKAEKWFYVKKDLNYSFLYIMFVVERLARIETISRGEVPTRKAIYQAVKHNPDFFNAVFTDLIDKRKDEATVRRALEMIDEYLEDRAFILFQPLFDFLTEAGGTRTATEFSEHFGKRQAWVGLACEWLAQKEIIEQFSSPLRLTKESQVSVEEPAYYYDADNPFWE